MAACGADTQHLAGSKYVCHVNLPNLLAPGDDRHVTYISEEQNAFKAAQKSAFIEIMAYVLFRGPRHLRTHATQITKEKFDEVVHDAENGLRGRLGSRPGGGPWSPQVSPENIAETRLSSRIGRGTYAGTTDDKLVIQALDSVGNAGQERSGQLPPGVWHVLRDQLPVGGLPAFLKRFPRKYEVVSEKPLVWRAIRGDVQN